MATSVQRCLRTVDPTARGVAFTPRQAYATARDLHAFHDSLVSHDAHDAHDFTGSGGRSTNRCSTKTMTDSGGSDQSKTQWFGPVPVAKNGTMTLPQPAREHLNLALDEADAVLVFTEPGRVTVTAVPPDLGAALLRLAVDAATEN